MTSVTTASLKPGDRVLGCTVLENRPVAGTDGEVTHHRLTVQDGDGRRRTARVPRRRRYVREPSPRV
jgi:hypothetical protein